MNYDRLIRLISDRGLNNAKLAALSGISAAAIGKIVSGADFKVSSLEAIARALNVPVSFFFEKEKGNNIVIGHQSIAGDDGTISGNTMDIPGRYPYEFEEHKTQNDENAREIITEQKDEIISLQKQVISLQGQLLETHKHKS